MIMIDKTDWQAVYRKLMEEEILQKDAPPPLSQNENPGDLSDEEMARDWEALQQRLRSTSSD
jgi:hypothetical protein